MSLNGMLKVLILKDGYVKGMETLEKMEGLEKLLVSNTIQLEAVTRLLLEKGVLKEDELVAMMKTVQAEYQRNTKL